MRSLGSSGIWELFLPGVGPGARYKYEILTQDGELPLKADPFALGDRGPAEDRVGRPSSPSTSGAQDAEWLRSAPRAPSRCSEPMSIYEVHLGSWRLNPLEGNRSLTYLELADELAPTSPTWASPTSSCCR